MLKKTPLKLKKTYSLKKTSLKRNKSLMKKTVLKKQNDKNQLKWLEIREKALKRDNYKCQICGKLATQVHHIHLRSKRKDLIYNLNNLISLCDKHHFHSASDLYLEQTQLIAKSKNMTVEELLKFAEMGDNND